MNDEMQLDVVRQRVVALQNIANAFRNECTEVVSDYAQVLESIAKTNIEDGKKIATYVNRILVGKAPGDVLALLHLNPIEDMFVDLHVMFEDITKEIDIFPEVLDSVSKRVIDDVDRDLADRLIVPAIDEHHDGYVITHPERTVAWVAGLVAVAFLAGTLIRKR